MSFLNKIKSFEDLKPFVIAEDNYFNPNGTKRITKKLINEMVQYIDTFYKPTNIDEIKQSLLDNITTRKGKIFISETNFEDLIENYDDIIKKLDEEKQKKDEAEENGKNPHKDHILNTNVNIIVYQRHGEPNKKPVGVKNYFFKDDYCYYTIKKQNLFT